MASQALSCSILSMALIIGLAALFDPMNFARLAGRRYTNTSVSVAHKQNVIRYYRVFGAMILVATLWLSYLSIIVQSR